MRHHDGVWVDVPWPHGLAVFPRVVDAIGFAARLRDRLNGHCRIGVNLADFEVSEDGGPGPGSHFAQALMKQSGPGGLTVSAVSGQRITSRLVGGEDGSDIATGWRGALYTGLQWGGLLGYFAAWMFGIYWVISYFVIYKTHLSWPEFMCG